MVLKLESGKGELLEPTKMLSGDFSCNRLNIKDILSRKKKYFVTEEDRLF